MYVSELGVNRLDYNPEPVIIYHSMGTRNLESSAGEIMIQFSTTW